MNDIERILANIAKIDYPEAYVLTYASGTFWVGGEANDGLFASDTHDQVFAAALGIDNDSGWTLWLNTPDDGTIARLAALADEALPDWTLVEVYPLNIYAKCGFDRVLIADRMDYPHLADGDRFARWNRATWEKAVQD